MVSDLEIARIVARTELAVVRQRSVVDNLRDSNRFLTLAEQHLRLLERSLGRITESYGALSRLEAKARANGSAESRHRTESLR
jgi:hypothetical protein